MFNLLDKEFLFVGKEKVESIKFNEVKNNSVINNSVNQFDRPTGGLWSCVFNENDEYKSQWVKFCCFNMNEWLTEKCVKFKLKEDARILVLNSYEKVKSLASEYPRNVNEVKSDEVKSDEIKSDEVESDETKSNLFDLDKKYVDFEKLSADYDGIFVDFDWYRKFRLEHNESKQYSHIFEQWNVSSLLLFNIDCIKEQESYTLDVCGVLVNSMVE